MGGAKAMAARIMVVGTGSIGRRHAENLTHLGAKVTAVGWRTTSADQVADKLQTGAFEGLVIATATQLRLPLIEAAAAAGVPIYVEKPLAYTSVELAACLTAAAPIASRSMLGFMMRYHPAFRDLAQTDLTDTYRFDFSIGHDVTQWRTNWRFSDSYAAKAQGGGVLLDLSHEIDMAACLFPGLTLGRVDCIGHAAYPGVDMASRVHLSAPGVSGSVSMDYLAPQLIRKAQICGTKATRDYDFAAQSYKVTTATEIKNSVHPLERNEMFLNSARDFIALITGNPLQGIDHFPRLDQVGASCNLVAQAWEQRRFNGETTKEIP
jgi:predicted dehydrogenase